MRTNIERVRERVRGATEGGQGQQQQGTCQSTKQGAGGARRRLVWCGDGEGGERGVVCPRLVLVRRGVTPEELE